MCLHKKGGSHREASKAQNNDQKISIENIPMPKKIPQEAENKGVSDSKGKMTSKEPNVQLATTGTQQTYPKEKFDIKKPKHENAGTNDNKNLKQNDVKQVLAKSFIAEYTQNTVSKSGDEIDKKNKSVIRDNTLEEIPADMPKYDSS